LTIPEIQFAVRGYDTGVMRRVVLDGAGGEGDVGEPGLDLATVVPDLEAMD
jgi:hypothetical protein